MIDNSNNTMNYCPLCDSASTVFYQFGKQLYHQCSNCYGIFTDKELRPDKKTEILRYQKHQNDIEDDGYQKFVMPITSTIMRDFIASHKGLDFGAGTGPVISKILKDNDFQIELYDPFFHNYPNLLKDQYNYIACCEVIEHFHNPKKEFKLLKKLLLKNGKLYCMTNIYNESIDFHNWDYISDKTHVFFYHKETIHWIMEKFGFSDVTINGRLIVYLN